MDSSGQLAYVAARRSDARAAQWKREAEMDPLAAPEWTLPARHVAVLAVVALAVCLGLAWIG